jgi:hypothetical protein
MCGITHCRTCAIADRIRRPEPPPKSNAGRTQVSCATGLFEYAVGSKSSPDQGNQFKLHMLFRNLRRKRRAQKRAKAASFRSRLRNDQ